MTCGDVLGHPRAFPIFLLDVQPCNVSAFNLPTDLGQRPVSVLTRTNPLASPPSVREPRSAISTSAHGSLTVASGESHGLTACNPTMSRFLSIPTELRLRIYAHILCEECLVLPLDYDKIACPVSVEGTTPVSGPSYCETFNILQVCHQCNDEAKDLVYQEAIFQLGDDPYHKLPKDRGWPTAADSSRVSRMFARAEHSG